MPKLSELLDAYTMPESSREIITKVYFEGNAPRPFVSRRYELTKATTDKNGKQALSAMYNITPLMTYQNSSAADSFIIYTHTRFKLPAKIDAMQLNNALAKQPQIFSNCINDLFLLQREAHVGRWIDELKKAVKDGASIQAAQIITRESRADFITNTGELVGVDWRFRVDHNTIQKLLQNLGIDPRQNSQIIAEIIEEAHKPFIAGYAVRLVTDADEISRIYAQTDDFTSCMRGLETPARIYAPYGVGSDGEALQSIGLYVLEKEGEFIARFAARLKNGKYPTIYTDYQSSKIEAILSELGHERNPSCFYGARLPLVTDEYNNVFMPYLDGDNKTIRLVEGETGAFLQVGGTKGEDIGEANGTRGYLRTNNSGHELGYNDSASRKDYSEYYHGDDDEDNEDRFYCEHCQEYCDDDQRNSVNGASICDYCLNNAYSECEDCNEYVENDSANYVEVYVFNDDDTESRTLCECCIDNYFLEPVKNDYYFNIASLKRHVTGG